MTTTTDDNNDDDDQEERRDSRDGSEVPTSREKVLEAGAMYIPFIG